MIGPQCTAQYTQTHGLTVTYSHVFRFEWQMIRLNPRRTFINYELSV